MHDDGSGVVTVDAVLDAAAVQAVETGGGKLEDRVRLGDLAAAGWTVGAWQRTPDGSASVSLTKPFSNPSEVSGILAEVNGAVGPLKDIHASRDRGLASTSYELSGAIDLGALQTGIASDPELLGNLTGQQIDVGALDASLVQELQRAVSVRVVAKLPGGTTTFIGESGKSVPVSAAETVIDTRRIVLFLVAAILIVLAFVVLLGGRRRRRRRVERLR